MRIGVPTWEGRVSPVLDTAERIAVFETSESGAVPGADLVLAGLDPAARAAAIRGRGLEVIVCGAVSGVLATLIEGADVRVVPWVTGDVDDIVSAYLNGRLETGTFRMPGCCARHRRGRRRGHHGQR